MGLCLQIFFAEDELNHQSTVRNFRTVRAELLGKELSWVESGNSFFRSGSGVTEAAYKKIGEIYMQVIRRDHVQEKIITLRNQQIIIDSDVAELYGVETKRINEAVSRNQDKFPNGYLFELNKQEWESLKSQFATSIIKGGKVRPPIAFTEKGLYMLATILKSPKAVKTTIAIIDTFAKVKEIHRVVHQLQALPEKSSKQKSLIDRTGDLIADLIIPENELEVTGTETTYEMNFAIFRIKRTVKKSK